MFDVVLLNDTSAWYHWGCTGTSTAIREVIQNLGLSLNSVPINNTYSFACSPKKLEDFSDRQFFAKCRNMNAGIFDAIDNAATVVINGEGTIHGSSKASLSVLYMATAAKRYLGKNVQIINHSCFPQSSRELSDALLCTLYKNVYEQLDFIAFREHISANLMSQLGINATLSFDCLPLAIHRHYPNPVCREDKLLVIAGSVAFEGCRIEELGEYIRIMRDNGFRIRLLTGAKAFPAPDDMNFIASLQEQTEGELEIVSAESLSEWLDCIASAALFVSGRFHHTIAAIMLKTPFVFMESNTPKNQALMEMMGMVKPLEYANLSFRDNLLSRTDQMLIAGAVPDAVLDSLCERALHNFDGLVRR